LSKRGCAGRRAAATGSLSGHAAGRAAHPYPRGAGGPYATALEAEMRGDAHRGEDRHRDGQGRGAGLCRVRPLLCVPGSARGCSPEQHPKGPLQGGLGYELERSGKLRRLARGEYGTGQAPPSGRPLNEWPLWLFHASQRCGTVVQYSCFMLHNDVAQYSKSQLCLRARSRQVHGEHAHLVIETLRPASSMSG
jgi:hypothetical protein